MLNKQAIFINTASQVIVKVVTLAFALISVKLLTNYLGTSGVGDFNAITTYINFFVVLADLGLFSVAVREIAKKPENEKRIISNVFIIRLISAIIAAAVAVAISYFTKYSNEVKTGVLIATGYLFLNLLSSVYDIILQYRLKMQYSALAEFLSKLITLAALYIIVKTNGGFLMTVGTIFLSGVSIFLFKYIFAKKFLSFGLSYDKTVARWIINISWPLGIAFIVNNLFFKLDTLMLYAIKGPSEVGIYSVAYKVLEVSVFVGSYFAASLKPAISKNIEKDKNIVANIVRKSLGFLLFAAAPITIVSVVFSREIILFLSNPDFISGSRALMLLAFTLPFIYFDTLLGEILVANDERRTLVKISVFILLFNFLTNLFFISKYSFMGAAFTTLLSEILLMAINIHYTKKIIDYKLDMAMLVKILIASLIVIALGFAIKDFLNIYFLIPMAICLAAYLLVTYLFGIFKYDNLKQMIKG